MLKKESNDVDDIKKKIDEFLTMEENRNNSSSSKWLNCASDKLYNGVDPFP